MRYLKWIIVLSVVMVLTTSAVGPAAAHETQEVEGYDITFGGADEPVITGERMWMEVEITDNETGEPVENQAEALTMSVDTSGAEKTALEASEKHGEPGVYEAPVIFPEPGDYVIHLEGSLEDTEAHTHFEKEVHDHTELEYPDDESQTTDDDDESQTDDNQSDESGTSSASAAIAAIGIVAAISAVLLSRQQ